MGSDREQAIQLLFELHITYIDSKYAPNRYLMVRHLSNLQKDHFLPPRPFPKTVIAAGSIFGTDFEDLKIIRISFSRRF